MNPREYEALYATEDRHWWFTAVRREIARAIERHAPAGERLRWLDVGSGTGGLLARLDAGRLGMRVGLEPATEGLRLSRRRSLRLVRGTVRALPFAGEAFDVVTSVDVLCHRLVAEDEALAEMFRALAPGGILVLQVPAFDWLWSEHDDAVWTKRRYRLPEVERMLRGAGLEIAVGRYRMSLLFPAAAARRLLGREAPSEAARSDVRPAPALANVFFGAVLRAEAALESLGVRLPFGLSVFCVARKPPGPAASDSLSGR